MRIENSKSLQLLNLEDILKLSDPNDCSHIQLNKKTVIIQHDKVFCSLISCITNGKFVTLLLVYFVFQLSAAIRSTFLLEQAKGCSKK